MIYQISITYQKYHKAKQSILDFLSHVSLWGLPDRCHLPELDGGFLLDVGGLVLGQDGHLVLGEGDDALFQEPLRVALFLEHHVAKLHSLLCFPVFCEILQTKKVIIDDGLLAANPNTLWTNMKRTFPRASKMVLKLK